MLREIKQILNTEPWLRVEESTGASKFQSDLVDLFRLGLYDAGEPFDALMLRMKSATGNLFYFTPEAAKFFEHRAMQIPYPEVRVTRCNRPWLHKYRLTLLAGTEVYWH